jgi:hypothetical protein
MDPDPDPTTLIIDLQGADKKTNLFKKKLFCLLLFEGTFTSFLIDKKSKRSHKTVGIKVFLIFLFLLNDRRIRILSRIHTSDWWIRIREAQKQTDPHSDPDLQHC